MQETASSHWGICFQNIRSLFSPHDGPSPPPSYNMEKKAQCLRCQCCCSVTVLVPWPTVTSHLKHVLSQCSTVSPHSRGTLTGGIIQRLAAHWSARPFGPGGINGASIVNLCHRCLCRFSIRVIQVSSLQWLDLLGFSWAWAWIFPLGWDTSLCYQRTGIMEGT